MTATTQAGLRYDDVEVGQELPGLDFPLTRTMIVSTAIASRDYQDVHHDPSLAQERGSKDIFMNILTTNGLVGRYVTDWAGPNAVLKAVRIRLGAPNYPGDTMVMSGAVTKKDGGVVEVTIRGANSLGDHVSGTVSLELHDPPISWGEVGAKGAKKKKDKKHKKKKG
jgi:acyl dehydratase